LALVFFFSYVNWFYMDYPGIPSGFVGLNKYIIFYIVTLLSVGFIIWRRS